MALLLDTCAFLWFTGADPAISQAAIRAIQDEPDVYVSAASAWEASIKFTLGKLELPQPPSSFFAVHLQANHFDLLPVELHHLQRLESLPAHHKDPFDRLIIAQAKAMSLTIVTNDRAFAAYGVPMIW